MGTIHKFSGDWNKIFNWEGTRTRTYQVDGVSQVSETWLIGKKEGAQNFAMRYYQLEPGGSSRKEQHPYDHGILILQGRGEVLIDQDISSFERGDIIYIPPDALHQLSNTGTDLMGFICVIPARREKGGKIVWAEEGIKFD